MSEKRWNSAFLEMVNEQDKEIDFVLQEHEYFYKYVEMSGIELCYAPGGA